MWACIDYSLSELMTFQLFQKRKYFIKNQRKRSSSTRIITISIKQRNQLFLKYLFLLPILIISFNFTFMQEQDLPEVMPLFAPIYDADFLEKNSLLSTAIKDKIFDQEGNIIAEQILEEDPSNYNAWYVKKMYILSHNQLELYQQEVQFVDSCLEQKVKGFQVWEQKRFLIELGYEWKDELKKVEKILLQKDQKNYHAWSFRVWLTNFAKIHSDELIFAEKMIKKDPFNNSAWTHLYFTLSTLVTSTSDDHLKKTLLSKYVQFSMKSLQDHNYNKACWNFLRGLFPSIRLQKVSWKNVRKEILIKSYDEYPVIADYCQSQWQKLNETAEQKKNESILMAQRELLATLVHIFSQKRDMLEYAKNICQELKRKQPQRANYWTWVENNL